MSENILQYFNAPNRLVAGWGAVSQIGEEAALLRSKRALIVTDQGVVGAGLVELVQQALEKAGISFTVYDRVQPDPVLQAHRRGRRDLQVPKLRSGDGRGRRLVPWTRPRAFR